MNRRGFIGFLAGGIAAEAVVRTFPFRVFSFPSEIVPAYSPLDLAPIYYSKEALQALVKHLRFKAIKPMNAEDFYAIVHPEVFKAYKKINFFRYPQ